MEPQTVTKAGHHPSVKMEELYATPSDEPGHYLVTLQCPVCLRKKQEWEHLLSVNNQLGKCNGQTTELPPAPNTDEPF